MVLSLLPPMAGNSRSVDEMLFALPPAEQVLVKRLRALIMECIPKATEHLYDDIDMPFYRHNKLICFIKPATATWKKDQTPSASTNKGTVLGFNQGYLMSNDEGLLLKEGRKQVYVLYLKSIRDLEEDKVRALLLEAALIDEQFRKEARDKK